MNIPGVSEIVTLMRTLPEKTDELITRLDRVIELLEEIRDQGVHSG